MSKDLIKGQVHKKRENLIKHGNIEKHIQKKRVINIERGVFKRARIQVNIIEDIIDGNGQFIDEKYDIIRDYGERKLLFFSACVTALLTV